MCAYRLVHVYVWPCACVRIWGCACVCMGLCMRKRLCMPYTCTYYIHMYVLACMSSKFAYIFCKLVLNASMYLIQCKWTTYEVVCTSSWMVLKVFSMAVHILGKMAVVCACSGVGIKVRPVSFNVLLCVLICLGKDIGGYFWSKQLLHWLFACLGPGACHALQPIHFSPHFHIQLSPYILPLPLIQWPLPLLSMWPHPLQEPPLYFSPFPIQGGPLPLLSIP